MATLIIAPSCAGKTTYLNRHFGSPFRPANPVVDGDFIVANGPGWPAAHRWWDDPVIGPLQQRASWRAILTHCVIWPRTVVLFNMDTGFIDLSAGTALLFGLAILAAVPPDDTLMRNARARATTGNTSQPSDEATVIAGARHVERWAMDHKVPLFSSIDAAVDHARTTGAVR